MLNAKCSQDDLYEVVQTVARGVSGRSTQPVQNNIYLSSQGDSLRLVATDLEYVSIDATIPAAVADEGAITVPARYLTAIASSLPGGEVSLEANESDTMAIACGSASYDIRGVSADDFQMLAEISEAVEFSLPQSELHELLRQTAFAASDDETRPILTGVLFAVSDSKLQLVATDTYRLALRSSDSEVKHEQRAIVSVRVLNELLRILDGESDDPAEISLAGTLVQFKVGAITMASRLIEGEFPNYEKVIPDEENLDKRITVSTEELDSALRRALIVAREDANRVVLRTTDSGLQITANSPDVGHVEEDIPAKLEGDPIETAFNAQYMLQMLDAAGSDEVTITLSRPLEPGVIRPSDRDDYIYVVMPMQIM